MSIGGNIHYGTSCACSRYANCIVGYGPRATPGSYACSWSLAVALATECSSRTHRPDRLEHVLERSPKSQTPPYVYIERNQETEFATLCDLHRRTQNLLEVVVRTSPCGADSNGGLPTLQSARADITIRPKTPPAMPLTVVSFSQILRRARRYATSIYMFDTILRDSTVGEQCFVQTVSSRKSFLSRISASCR